MKHCPSCNSLKEIKDFYTRRGTQTHSYCKPCVNKQTVQRQRDLKAKAVEYKGGVCEGCKESYHPAVFDFHHVNPEDKEFNISRFRSLKWSDKIEKELDKCELLCANCHRLAHVTY